MIMADIENKINAEVISVGPDKIRISVDDLNDFQLAEEKLRVGSYLRISDSDNAVLIAIIENFTIDVGTDTQENATRKYIIEAYPLGMLKDGMFERGGDTLSIPPKKVEPARTEDIKRIFETSVKESDKFVFSTLSSDNLIPVPVDGNKFFNKHIAVIGSTGSGKSHTVAHIIQEAIRQKNGRYDGLNNSHIVIFDIHSEYKTAFPDANYLDISNLVLPYWLLNSDELQELFIDTEANDHNQRNVFKEAVVNGRKNHFNGTDEEKDKIHFDSLLFFDINEVLQFAKAKNEEMIVTGEVYASGAKKGQPKLNQGTLNGKLTNFVSRLENKLNDRRLDFLLGSKSKQIHFDEAIKQFIGYGDNMSNVTIIDLSGVPFDVLSISVSLISRILFEFGYYFKRYINDKSPESRINNETPLLLVYEEAHKYVPNSEAFKYRASKESIERIAKEGRKYGVSLLLASQRPSEISDTIFSQCSNFIAMRLTNPTDQSYVNRLLPDAMGSMMNKLSSLKVGEALLLGEAVVLPSVVQIGRCAPEPSSNDIPYLQLWKEQWKDVEFGEIVKRWE